VAICGRLTPLPNQRFWILASFHSHRHPWLNKLNATAKAAAFHGFNASTRSDPASTRGWSKFVVSASMIYRVIAGDLSSSLPNIAGSTRLQDVNSLSMVFIGKKSLSGFRGGGTKSYFK
jgi:hypothetical protein